MILDFIAPIPSTGIRTPEQILILSAMMHGRPFSNRYVRLTWIPDPKDAGRGFLFDDKASK